MSSSDSRVWRVCLTTDDLLALEMFFTTTSLWEGDTPNVFRSQISALSLSATSASLRKTSSRVVIDIPYVVIPRTEARVAGDMVSKQRSSNLRNKSTSDTKLEIKGLRTEESDEFGHSVIILNVVSSLNVHFLLNLRCTWTCIARINLHQHCIV